MAEYNDECPHDSLEDLTPWEYLAKHQQAENSNYACTGFRGWLQVER